MPQTFLKTAEGDIEVTDVVPEKISKVVIKKAEVEESVKQLTLAIARFQSEIALHQEALAQKSALLAKFSDAFVEEAVDEVVK